MDEEQDKTFDTKSFFRHKISSRFKVLLLEEHRKFLLRLKMKQDQLRQTEFREESKHRMAVTEQI